MSEKESVSVHRITGTRNDSDEVKAVDEGDITVYLDMSDPKDIQVTKGKEKYGINFGGGILELEITDKAAHALVEKLEGIEAKG